MNFDEIVEEVRALPAEQRRELIMVLVDSLIQPDLMHEASQPALVKPNGVGPEIWQEADPQDYGHKLRIEWDDRA